ncbi:MAG TPA: DEAD/DEAH box helicase family protein [Thermoanaerobaculia bacterium]|nr:DEAD/DEAH box helicase family protein [Thermoanaerobaculia bacterium]
MALHDTEAGARLVIDELLRQAGWDPTDRLDVGTEVPVPREGRSKALLGRFEAHPYEKHAPVYDLTAAAGAFGPDREVGTRLDELGWLPVPDSIRLTQDHFIVRIQGKSMEPRIPDGSYCLFRADRGGSRQGKLVLVWQRGSVDPALGGEFSVKKYESRKVASAEGDWVHQEIRLKPLNPDPAFRDLVFGDGAEGHLRVLGELVSVIDAPAGAEPTPPGRADYVLYGRNGRPLAVIEAKRNAIHPYVAKQQALPYAQSLGAPFIFLTNGDLIYFWDYQNDDARPVASLFSRRDLERLLEMRENRRPLATQEIPEFFVRKGETWQVRPYQRDTMRAMDQAFELGKRRFLIELPTGTGKTDLICLYLKRLLQAGWAERALFLVDREQLAKQALEAIQDILGEYSSYWLKPGMDRQEKQVTVCLLQTMISRVSEYTAGDFDVVVADESHRSIYGAWQSALVRFEALHIGLTATPANFIERNTYRFYQCKPGLPDFSYPFDKAVEQEFLVSPRFATGITEILSEGADVEDEHYDPMAFEKEWTNEATNRLMVEELDRLAWENYQESAPGQKEGPGKTIVFAITKHHAARLAQYLNELHPALKGNYAAAITSDVPDADALIRKFQRDPYPMVAVSVGMLDTGFNCREILHLALCRRVRSPILYQQMLGRGTRTAPHIGKRRFVVYDFFRNRQYFQERGFLAEGPDRSAAADENGARKPFVPPMELDLEDEWLEAVSYVEVGPLGERFEKADYLSQWEKTIRTRTLEDRLLQRVKEDQALTSDEEAELAARLNSPEYYFNEDNLRRAYRNPGGTLVDFIRAALGGLKLKSREEKLDEAFRGWLVLQNLSPRQADYLILLKNRGIATGRVRIEDLFEPPLAALDMAAMGVQLFGEARFQEIIEDLDTSVFQTYRG